jgi:hypothetical protein
VGPSGAYITDRLVPLSRITLEAADINVSDNGGAATPVYFSSPVFLAANKEYAIVVKPGANNPNTSLFVSRLGGRSYYWRENKQAAIRRYLVCFIE